LSRTTPSIFLRENGIFMNTTVGFIFEDMTAASPPGRTDDHLKLD
jgi:hypothetical protein